MRYLVSRMSAVSDGSIEFAAFDADGEEVLRVWVSPFIPAVKPTEEDPEGAPGRLATPKELSEMAADRVKAALVKSSRHLDRVYSKTPDVNIDL